MRSSHALVLYENCNRYIGTGQTPVWDLEIFRKLMAVEGRYKEFKFLKRDVIMPAMKEVNSHSNILVDLLTVRKGRAVAALQFTVKTNPQLALLGMEEDDEISSSEAYKALLKQGVSKTLARSWMLEHGEEYVLDKIDLTNSLAASGNIKHSKAGFLKSAIEEDYHNENAVKKKALETAQATKVEREKLEHQVEALKMAQREAETSFRRSTAEIVEEAYEKLSGTQKEAVTAEFLRSLSSRVYVDAFKSGGWKDRLNFLDIRKFWEVRGLSLPSPSDWAQKNGSQEPEIIKAKIDELEAQLNKFVV